MSCQLLCCGDYLDAMSARLPSSKMFPRFYYLVLINVEQRRRKNGSIYLSLSGRMRHTPAFGTSGRIRELSDGDDNDARGWHGLRSYFSSHRETADVATIKIREPTQHLRAESNTGCYKVKTLSQDSLL
mmetsp:Transcript_36086/g.76948  ORF Transcript_36086/g.76948 Transcript_36086/m.76948 type:complete len:129 (+) Transcript_36086:196-582(+)